jgi:hypothetical protein
MTSSGSAVSAKVFRGLREQVELDLLLLARSVDAEDGALAGALETAQEVEELLAVGGIGDELLDAGPEPDGVRVQRLDLSQGDEDAGLVVKVSRAVRAPSELPIREEADHRRVPEPLDRLHLLLGQRPQGHVPGLAREQEQRVGGGGALPEITDLAQGVLSDADAGRAREAHFRALGDRPPVDERARPWGGRERRPQHPVAVALELQRVLGDDEVGVAGQPEIVLVDVQGRSAVDGVDNVALGAGPNTIRLSGSASEEEAQKQAKDCGARGTGDAAMAASRVSVFPQ